MNPDPKGDSPQVTAWSVVDPYLESVEIHDGPVVFLRAFAEMPKAAGHLFAVLWCDHEICNGGFHQFFSNSTGVLAPEAVHGYRATGLEECATLLERAMSMFGEVYPRERHDRQSGLCNLERPGNRREEWDPFHELDNLYYDAKDRADFEEVLVDFARRHSQ